MEIGIDTLLIKNKNLKKYISKQDNSKSFCAKILWENINTNKLPAIRSKNNK